LQWLINGSCNGYATVLQWLLLTVAITATAPILLKAVNPVNTPIAMALQWFCNGSPTVFYKDGATAINVEIELSQP
jgi:hypothetical protein